MRTKLLFVLKIFLLGLVVLGSVEFRLKLVEPMPFTVKGRKITLPASKQYTFVTEGSRKIDRVVIVKKNSLGFRGPELPADPENYLRLVTVGGSAVANDNLSEGKTWQDLLATRLNARLGHVWMNNAGFTGQSTFGNILVMEDYIVRLKPTAVLILLPLNDLEVDAPRNYDDDIVQGRFQSGTFLDFARSVARNIETVGLISNLYRKYIHNRRNVSYEDLDLATAKRLTLTADDVAAAVRLNEEHFIPAFRERLQRLISLSRDNGIEPIFITEPVLYGDTKDALTGVYLGDLEIHPNRNGLVMERILELYNDEIRALAASGVTVIDLDHALPKNSLYYIDFTHFSNEGADKVAEILSEQLLPSLSGLRPGSRS